jgi:hypothetical protein
VLATATGNSAGGTGTVTLTALYTDPWGNPYSGQYSYSVNVPDVRTYTPIVTPKGNPTAYTEANISTNYVFSVQNSGDTQAVYTLSTPTCTGTTTGCSIATNPVTVNAGQTVSVPVSFTTGAAGQVVSIDLHATTSAHGVTFADDRTVQVVPTAATVQVTPLDGTPSGKEGSGCSFLSPCIGVD